MTTNLVHRTIGYGISRLKEGAWVWTYYPKIEDGRKTSGEVTGTWEDACAACRAAIDKWLGSTSD